MSALCRGSAGTTRPFSPSQIKISSAACGLAVRPKPRRAASLISRSLSRKASASADIPSGARVRPNATRARMRRQPVKCRASKMRFSISPLSRRNWSKRESGLIEKRIFEARHFTGWRRMRALVALGRTRAAEGISALAEALRDSDLEIRLAALRGLGRTASPQAAEEILIWLGEKGLVVPALPLQSALIQCCAERPQLLLPYVQNAKGALREALGRVLGEVATPSLGMDLLQFVVDDLDELRAAAARALAHTHSGVSFAVLAELAHDRTWFVRLRAVVSLGKLSGRLAIPPLLRGLTDSNRLVRLRAAEALVGISAEAVPIFQQVVASRDRYALHAYLTAVENANLLQKLEDELQNFPLLAAEERTKLQNALRSGSLGAEAPTAPPEVAEVPVSP